MLPPFLNLMSSTSPFAAAAAAGASQSQHPPSLTNQMATPQAQQLQMPDLELKMSTSRLSDQPGPSRSTPYFGTVRVT
jgi:hypothetical protein